eukprot:TRINITY_DN1232_c2_g1_i1.p1 TRINITY_DN1232_c2_g1~~TRINITY_DN1232_c2_g1_i1.p1  ORF type:complete len:229 (+),score=14.82 TRINITY_DN1232_c2_g1_i1:57-743(+)
MADLARNRIKDKATLRWCISYTNSVGIDPAQYKSLEDFVCDGWGLVVLIELLTDRQLFSSSMVSKGKPRTSLGVMNNLYEVLTTLVESYNFDLWGITTEGLLRRDCKQVRALLHLLLKRTGDSIVWENSITTTKAQIDKDKLLLRWLQSILNDYGILIEGWADCNEEVIASVLQYMVPSFELHNMSFCPENKDENLKFVLSQAYELLQIEPPTLDGTESEHCLWKSMR